jgi:hypothetical protein
MSLWWQPADPSPWEPDTWAVAADGLHPRYSVLVVGDDITGTRMLQRCRRDERVLCVEPAVAPDYAVPVILAARPDFTLLCGEAAGALLTTVVDELDAWHDSPATRVAVVVPSDEGIRCLPLGDLTLDEHALLEDLCDRGTRAG